MDSRLRGNDDVIEQARVFHHPLLFEPERLFKDARLFELARQFKQTRQFKQAFQFQAPKAPVRLRLSCAAHPANALLYCCASIEHRL